MTGSDLTEAAYSSNYRGMQHCTHSARPCLAQFCLAVFSALVFSILGLSVPPAWADPGKQPSLVTVPTEPDTFGINSPLGRVSYHAGRGLRLGKTGLTIGGFAIAEMERLEDGERSGALEEFNFLISYDPVPFAHLFTELGIGSLAKIERGRKGVHSDPALEVERLFLDLGNRDALKLRFGKYRTPIGRWNLIPRDPLLWTTSEPVIVEEVFDETSTGAMLHGSVFPQGGALSYSLYGTFLPPLDAESDERPVRRSAGAHIE